MELNTDTETNICGTNLFTRKLVCVNYPGFVEDVDKMMEKLGGLTEIENVVSQKGRNLELKFRPKDKFCKPTISDTDKKAGVLVKVSQKTEAGKKSEFDYQVLGVNALSYSFNKPCDFQYLPLVTDGEESKDTPLRYIYNDLVPDKLPENPEKDWLADENLKDMPLYAPSAVFSRFDYLQSGLPSSRLHFSDKKFGTDLNESNPHSKRRNKSTQGTKFCHFRDLQVPSSPPALALKIVDMRIAMKTNVEKIKKLFDERPIWSRGAILYLSKAPREQVRMILPTVAYFYPDGPWRTMWVRYGYNPKEDPSARIYQTFDFRVRLVHGLKEAVMVKSKPVLPRKKNLDEVIGASEESWTLNENIYRMKPGSLPPARQTFYQYCEIHLPEIQSMLSLLPPTPPGTKCDRKNGFLPDKFTEQCREIFNRYVENEVRKLEKDKNENKAVPSTSKASETNVYLEIESTSSEDDINYEDENSDENGTDEEIPEGKERKSGKDDSFSDEDFIDKEAAEEVHKLIENNYSGDLRNVTMSDSD